MSSFAGVQAATGDIEALRREGRPALVFEDAVGVVENRNQPRRAT